jgi:hypothetical protein
MVRTYLPVIIDNKNRETEWSVLCLSSLNSAQTRAKMYCAPLAAIPLGQPAHMCSTTLLALLHSDNLRVVRDVDAWVQSVW